MEASPDIENALANLADRGYALVTFYNAEAIWGVPLWRAAAVPRDTRNPQALGEADTIGEAVAELLADADDNDRAEQ